MKIVVIKNFNKPKCCGNCPLRNRITNDCMVDFESHKYNDFETQYKNCPLIVLESEDE
jgi:hypothetical protein